MIQGRGESLGTIKLYRSEELPLPLGCPRPGQEGRAGPAPGLQHHWGVCSVGDRTGRGHPSPGPWGEQPPPRPQVSRLSPGPPERAEAGLPAPLLPCLTAGGLGCGSVLGGGSGTRSPGEGPQAAGTPERLSVWFLGNPLPAECRWASAGRRLGPRGPAWPSAYKVLEGAWPGAQRSHTLIVERSPVGRGAWGHGRGGLGTCAHVCTHVHAYRHTHMYTLTYTRPSTGTAACTQPTRVAPKAWQ